MKILKRDGRIKEFDFKRISEAIRKAYDEVYQNENYRDQQEQVVDDVFSIIASTEEEFISVEDVQDIIIETLKNYNSKVAKAYSDYREERNIIRESKISLIKEITGLVNNTNIDVLTENSNKQSQLSSTQRDLIAGEVSKYISKTELIPKHLMDAHNKGIIKIHDLDYYMQPIYNCFDKTTKVITNKGTFSFEELGEGAEIEVPTHTGEWKKAIVKSYGYQDLYKMTFKRQNGMTKEVICTANHRWILDNGEITTNIKIGDRLQETPVIENFNIEDLSREEKESWILGFILGDGTDYTHKDSYGCQVRLCGKKNKYRFIFDELGYGCFNINDETDDVVYIIPKMRKQMFLDKKEYKNLNKKQKIALINGLYCADASVYKDSFKMFTNVDSRILEMVRELSEVAGYYLNGEFIVEGKTNYTPNGRKPLTYIQFNKKQYRVKWRLVEKQYIKRDVVWCLEVEDNHSFILSNGMVTGNCELINLEDMLQNGTVINKKKIDKPKSLRTAMTLATQISAQVASCTYGGQTISLSHLAPFVRISKEKIQKKYNEMNLPISKDKLNKLVEKELKDEIKDSVQTFNYQVSTLQTTNGQSPFISVAMYISENPEYEEETVLLIEEFLRQRIKGMKNEYDVIATQTFPKLLYFLDENNTYEDSKYFWLTQLAVKSVSIRMSPDFISVKKMKELTGYAFPCIKVICA